MSRQAPVAVAPLLTALLALLALLALPVSPAVAQINAPPPPPPPQGAPSQPPPPPPPPQGPPLGTAASPPDPGFEQITFNLASRSFNRVLPFDAPFQLAGPVPPDVTRIELQYASSRQTIVPVKTTSACQPTQLTTAQGSLSWQPDPPVVWTYSPLLGPANFVLTVPALDAQRYYLFKFKLESRPSDARAATFQQAAKALFDQRLNQLKPLTDFGDQDIDEIRAHLIADIKGLLGGDHVSTIVPGTLFDPCVDPAAVRGRVHDLVKPIINLQNKISVQVEQVLLPSWDSLSAALDQIRNDPQLADLLNRLEAKAKTDPATDRFVQRNNGANLATARVTAKADLLGPPPPRTGGGTAIGPSTLADSIRLYDAALQRLQELSSWLAEMAHPQDTTPAGVKAVVTDADRRALDRLVSDAGAVGQAVGFAARLRDAAASLQDKLAQRSQALDELAQQVRQEAVTQVVVDATTTGNGNTFHRTYLSFDLGFLYSWGISKVVPYAGTNIYFVPINTNVPLSQKGGFRRRFSLTLGYTLQGIADANEQTRKDFAASGSLVVGAGYRLTESIRVAAGALIFYKKNRDPLVSGEDVAATPYVSFSFDVNVAKTFSRVGQVFFSNP